MGSKNIAPDPESMSTLQLRTGTKNPAYLRKLSFPKLTEELIVSVTARGEETASLKKYGMRGGVLCFLGCQLEWIIAVLISRGSSNTGRRNEIGKGWWSSWSLPFCLP